MRFLLSLCALVWLSIVLAGVFYLARYENTPAAYGNHFYPTVFPAESRIERDAEQRQATLVFFAHPKCPCTRASLRELARLMTDLDGKLRATVVFIKPKGESAQWTETDLRAKAGAIPNVRVVIDEDERETRIFGAESSGLALVYDGAGNLQFAGGITASRGHEGDNAGSRAVFEIVTRQHEKEKETLLKTTETAVFGCPLHKKDCHDGEVLEKLQ